MSNGKLSFNREQSFLAFLLFLMMVMNYLDRQALSVIAPVMRKELGVSVMGYANAVNAFLFAYSIMYAGSGIVLDRIGYRAGLAIFRRALVDIFRSPRVDYGLHLTAAVPLPSGLNRTGWIHRRREDHRGEIRPVAASAAPPARSACGTGLGSLIAPPLIVFLTLRYGWRAAFLIASSVGVIWIPFWLLATRGGAPKKAAPAAPVNRTIPRDRARAGLCAGAVLRRQLRLLRPVLVSGVPGFLEAFQLRDAGEARLDSALRQRSRRHSRRIFFQPAGGARLVAPVEPEDPDVGGGGLLSEPAPILQFAPGVWMVLFSLCPCAPSASAFGLAICTRW